MKQIFCTLSSRVFLPSTLKYDYEKDAIVLVDADEDEEELIIDGYFDEWTAISYYQTYSKGNIKFSLYGFWDSSTFIPVL